MSSSFALIICTMMICSCCSIFQFITVNASQDDDGARMVSELIKQYPSFDNFTYIYTYNWYTNKTHLEMYGDIGNNVVDVNQIGRIASELGFSTSQFTQFAKTNELFMTFDKTG